LSTPSKQGSRVTSFFNSAYLGTPPWDIGRPQEEFVRLARSVRGKLDVIDLGCGTGEHSMLFASRGHRVLGVDLAPRAIAKARVKAAKRASPAEFVVADALALQTLGGTFDMALDSGLFHVFSDPERVGYIRGLGHVLRPGGVYYMLCFSEREPDWGGPRRVRKDEILGCFSKGWKVESIRPSRFDSSDDGAGAEAWFCKISKPTKGMGRT